LGVLFVGDFIMPYIGAPFVVEGDLQGLLDAIDVVVQKNPRYMLHGHEPLMRNFSSPDMLPSNRAGRSRVRAGLGTQERVGMAPEESGWNEIRPVDRSACITTVDRSACVTTVDCGEDLVAQPAESSARSESQSWTVNPF
jgi:hypothetical protein